MIVKADRLLEQALQLSQKARAELASSLIRSLDDRVDQDAEAAWAAEVDRRLDELDTGKVKTISWGEVRKSLLKARRARKRRR